MCIILIRLIRLSHTDKSTVLEQIKEDHVIKLPDRNFFLQKPDTWTDSSGKSLNWKFTHTAWREKMAWCSEYSENPLHPLQERNSYLTHHNFTSTIPWFPILNSKSALSPSHAHSGRHLCAVALHSLILYSDPAHFRLPICECLRLLSNQTLSRINTPTISSRLFFIQTTHMKMEETERSETSVYKIKTPVYRLKVGI
jgi:hypothetical protein